MITTRSNRGHFPFLCLPRELRDQIYSLILCSRREDPKSLKNEGSRCLEKTFLRKDGRGKYNGAFHGVRYEGSFVGYACASLLCCNRQISQEAVEAIQLERDHSKYRADIMFTYLDMWPTWIMLPAPTTYLKIVEVDFRSCDERNSLGWSTSGLRDKTMQNFLRLLSQFIVRGPRFICKACDRNVIKMYAPSLCQDCQGKGLHIDVLIVNFVRVRGFTKPLVPFRNLDGEDLPIRVEGRALWNLASTLGKIANSGLVSGKIDLIRLR